MDSKKISIFLEKIQIFFDPTLQETDEIESRPGAGPGPRTTTFKASGGTPIR